MAIKPMRYSLYQAMRAAITGNMGYIYRNRDTLPGPQAGLGTLLRLEKWGWVRLVRVTVTDPRTQQRSREVVGGWILGLGRAALRNEVNRLGDDMPTRLVIPERTPAVPNARTNITTAAVRPPNAAPAGAIAPTRTATAVLDRPRRRPLAYTADPFTLIATGSGNQLRDDEIPF